MCSPNSGPALRIEPGLVLDFGTTPGSVTVPNVGWATSTSMSRAA